MLLLSLALADCYAAVGFDYMPENLLLLNLTRLAGRVIWQTEAIVRIPDFVRMSLFQALVAVVKVDNVAGVIFTN